MDDLAMLRLQLEWGADEALDEAPVERLRAAAATVPAAAPPPRPVAARAAGVAAGTPVERAIRAAARADTPEALKAAIAGFDGCALRDMATHTVFAAGDFSSGTLVAGGAPGADDDRSGLPFQGREGALLDRMFSAVGWKRESFLLTPLIPWRPPGGRVPVAGEIQVCLPFLTRLIALTGTELVVAFGAQAVGAIGGGASRGRGIGWRDVAVDGRTVRLLAMPGLGEVLKTPARRREAWEGMRVWRREAGQ